MNLKNTWFSLLLVTACGGPLKYQVASTPKAPGADAKIVADVHEAQNQTELEVEISNLAPPARISEGSSNYVAWFRKSSETVWARIGGINYDTDSRDGKLKGTVPEQAFDFEVTAEKSEAPASPSSDVVFSQRVAK